MVVARLIRKSDPYPVVHSVAGYGFPVFAVESFSRRSPDY
jgi:hypothetical protein